MNFISFISSPNRSLMTVFGTVLFVGALCLLFAEEGRAESLAAELAAKRQASVERTPADKRAVMMAAQESLANSKILESAPKQGDRLPDSKLMNVNGNGVSLFEVLGGRPAVVTFYRGGWCPYCNLQLRAYQQIIPEINKLGAKLVAITPETPDNSLETIKRDKLEFDVLSDLNNHFARQLGIVFKIEDSLKAVYQGFGIDLERNQDNNSWELPLAATFVVDAEQKIHYAFVDTDYTKRAEPEVLLAHLKKLK